MPNKPVDTNQLPVTPELPDSIESQSTEVVQKTQEEVIALLQQENAQLNSVIKSLQIQLMYDELTGLENRHFLKNWMKNNMNSEFNFIMLSADLNKFKPINDTYWHHVGDDALKLMADVIREVVTYLGWFVARTGGDEFVGIFAWEINPEFIGESIRVTLESKFNKWVISHDGTDIHNIPFTASIWLASAKDIDLYKDFLRNEYNQKLAENTRELEEFTQSLREHTDNSSETMKEMLEWNIIKVKKNREKIEEEFNKAYNDTNYNLAWKISELALKFAKKAVNHIRVFDERCLLPITDSLLVDKLVKDMESWLRNVKDTESAKVFCESLIHIIQEFLSKISK